VKVEAKEEAKEAVKNQDDERSDEEEDDADNDSVVEEDKVVEKKAEVAEVYGRSDGEDDDANDDHNSVVEEDKAEVAEVNGRSDEEDDADDDTDDEDQSFVVGDGGLSEEYHGLHGALPSFCSRFFLCYHDVVHNLHYRTGATIPGEEQFVFLGVAQTTNRVLSLALGAKSEIGNDVYMYMYSIRILLTYYNTFCF